MNELLPRLAPLLIWCVGVMLSIVYIVAGSPNSTPRGPQAANFLAANAVVTARDLVWPNIEGRYVARPAGIAKGMTLDASYLADRPALPTDPAPRLLMAMPLSRGIVEEGANVASQVSLCDGPSLFAKAVIETLQCDPSDEAADCNAYLRLDAADAAKVTAIGVRVATLRLAATCTPEKR